MPYHAIILLALVLQPEVNNTKLKNSGSHVLIILVMVTSSPENTYSSHRIRLLFLTREKGNISE